MQKITNKCSKSNVAIDVVKLILSYMVVAIHTEPFGFSFWLDKGFGIITRICVPFFFVASSYFFFLKKGSPFRYINRLLILYVVWSLIYLPFDIPALKTMSIWQILIKYLWTGNGHALWYLCGSIIGFIVVYLLAKVLSPKKVLVTAVVFLIIGCLKSTYLPLVSRILPIQISDYLGSRNGVFYAFPYYALGLFIADKNICYDKPQKKNIVALLVCFFLLCVESIVMVWFFKTKATIIWLSVFPLTYNFFVIVKDLHIPIKDNTGYFLRKCSTSIYVSHCLFMYCFPNLLHWKSFLVSAFLATVFSVVITFMSKNKFLGWMKFLS